MRIETSEITIKLSAQELETITVALDIYLNRYPLDKYPAKTEFVHLARGMLTELNNRFLQ